MNVRQYMTELQNFGTCIRSGSSQKGTAKLYMKGHKKEKKEKITHAIENRPNTLQTIYKDEND